MPAAAMPVRVQGDAAVAVDFRPPESWSHRSGNDVGAFGLPAKATSNLSPGKWHSSR
jgi:hypothetical protein